MRILHVVHQYPPEYIGGVELYTRTLAHAQAERGHQVTVFYRVQREGAGQTSRTEDGVQVWASWAGIANPTRRLLDTWQSSFIARAFDRVLDETRPDLVHIQHLMGLPASVAHALTRREVPYLITLHDYWWVCANAQLITNYSGQVCGGPSLWLNCARCALARAGADWLWPASPGLVPVFAWRSNLLRRVLRQARWLIAPAPFVKEWYTQHGIPAQKVQVVPHGVDAPVVPIPHRPSGGPIRFVYIGGLTWQKGLHVLVEAFSEIKGNAELVIAGDESFDPAYVAGLQAKSSPKVRFAGRLAREQVWETLAQADAVVIPSLWFETFSLLAHEAFAAGVPVIVSRHGALADAVRDSVDGLQISPGDVMAWRSALQQLVDEPQRLEQLRASVHPPMTLNEHVNRIEAVYNQL